MKVVLASGNPGKIKELQSLLTNLNIHLVTQTSLNVTEIEETELTFIENALTKARHASSLTGLAAIADDSGLIIPALNDAPGLYSARYAGTPSNAQNNINKVLNELENIPDNERIGMFYCVLVFLSHAEDPMPLVCEGKWVGKILKQPIGANGFGYDPIFFVEQEQCSAAELSLERKNIISHRGQALQLLLKKLPEKLCLRSQSKI